VSEAEQRGVIMRGSGGPITERGLSVAYLPPPWHMRGRTLAMWFRLADPDEARRHVPSYVEMEDDPIVRARFWDMTYDAVVGDRAGTRGRRRFLEAVVAFPVRYGDISGDYPAHMYADDWVYIVAGREVQGWNVRGGEVDVDPEPAGGPAAGVLLSAELRRDGWSVMRARLELSGRELDVAETAPLRWLTTKILPDAAGDGAAVGQLLSTGPLRVDGRRVWQATAQLSFGAAPGDELHHLAPREIVDAQYWSDVDITVGWATVLRELGDEVWTRG
jgi:acetoacetate decarboxylase